MVTLFIRSAAKRKEPLSTTMKSGHLPSSSLFILPAMPFTARCISSEEMHILKFLSFILTLVVGIQGDEFTFFSFGECEGKCVDNNLIRMMENGLFLVA